MYQLIRSSSNHDEQSHLIEEKVITSWERKYGKIHKRINLKLNILIALSVVKLFTVLLYY